ncbi:MAG: hypothetical protein HFG15_02035 [Bacilli bacterium]|jgi:hypothetical protein|nr:hypothetical protein [Bacilli bacterium]
MHVQNIKIGNIVTKVGEQFVLLRENVIFCYRSAGRVGGYQDLMTDDFYYTIPAIENPTKSYVHICGEQYIEQLITVYDYLKEYGNTTLLNYCNENPEMNLEDIIEAIISPAPVR